MTTEHMASRTLVKSPPELWAECSDAGSLARHIGEFGEIRITRLDPETSIAWEAEHAIGTVQIEPSGWGTRVTLTAQPKVEEVVPEPALVGPAETEAIAASAESPIAAAESPIAAAESPIAAAESPITHSDAIEEETDAKVEEKVAESDPALADDSFTASGRWKRLIARTRTWFRPEVEPIVPEAAVAEADKPIEALAGHVGPPEAELPTPEPAVPEPSAIKPVAIEPAPAQPAVPESAAAEPQTVDHSDLAEDGSAPDPEAILTAALDSLGQAHHRPFSRA